MKHQEKLLLQLPLIILVTVLLYYTTSNAQTVPQIAEKALAATVSLEMRIETVRYLAGGAASLFNLLPTTTSLGLTYTIEGITATDKTNDLVIRVWY